MSSSFIGIVFFSIVCKAACFRSIKKIKKSNNKEKIKRRRRTNDKKVGFKFSAI
ncbi:hypothetical protein BH18THE2_BH18THE2_41990 [soil metagenome]